MDIFTGLMDISSCFVDKTKDLMDKILLFVDILNLVDKLFILVDIFTRFVDKTKDLMDKILLFLDIL